MRVFDGWIDRLLHKSVLNPISGQPFAAPGPLVDFVDAQIMQSVSEDYRHNKGQWPTRHLPVVVGQLRPEVMQQLSGLAEDPNFDVTFNIQPTDFARTARQMVKRLNRQDVKPEVRSYLAGRNQIGLLAGLMNEVMAQDERWFGKSFYPSMILNRETIVPMNEYGHGAKGRFTFAGAGHRDALADENGAYSRLYLLRTTNPMWMLANRLTVGFEDAREGDYKGQVTDKRLPAVKAQHATRPQPGQIVLVNGGHGTGTVHGSHMPGPREGGPSCFIAINCVL